MTLATEGLLDAVSIAIEDAGARGRRTLASATVAVDSTDVSGAVLASRLASDRWFCWEQPDRDGFALGALGSAQRGRFARPRALPARRGATALSCCATPRSRRRPAFPPVPARSGPGDSPSTPTADASPPWASLPPALMVLPELSLLRSGERCRLTLNAIVVDGESGAERAMERLRRRLEGLREARAGATRSVSHGRPREIDAPRPPGPLRRGRRRGVERIRAGELEKMVLAREITVDSAAAHDAGPILGALREVFPSCFCFCVGTPEAAFIGASPELLIRRRGAVAATVALAGSTRRSADPAVDDHLGEQMLHSDKVRDEHGIVARRIARALRPLSVWVRARRGARRGRAWPTSSTSRRRSRPSSRTRARRSSWRACCIPRPRWVGSRARPRLRLIERLEGLDRGWYAGPVGWMDAAEDGEFCVALRSGLLRDRTAHLYAGCGIVAGSEPAAELAETEIKLEALLPLIAG